MCDTQYATVPLYSFDMIFHVRFSNWRYLTLLLPGFFLSNLCVVECLFTISTSRVIGFVCASYLDSHWYATVNRAIIYLYHGLLSVRYAALYDRIETGLKGSDLYLLRNVNGSLEKTSINTFPGKCQNDVHAGTSFFKNNVPCATEGRSTLFIFLSNYSIS